MSNRARSRLVLIGVVSLTTAACGPAASRPEEPVEGGPCDPGATADCYSGVDGTEDVGPCHGGRRSCDASGTWGKCQDEVSPSQELCGDGVDNNCNGAVDEDEDRDKDGVSTCGGDCCDSTECSAPALVNAGAFDAPDNKVDDDCNGVVDDQIPPCDGSLQSNSANGIDYAKAIDLCQTTTLMERKWGVISAHLTLADGTSMPAPQASSIRARFGAGVLPQGGVKLALLSTGSAAGRGDTNPNYHAFGDTTNFFGNNKESGFPNDFVMANGGKLPNAPGCPPPGGLLGGGDKAMDPVMLTLQLRAPTNARSFKLKTNFFSSEFPEYTCSPFNDFFVVLLDSAYAGSPANPMDKNLAFYQAMSGRYPVGVNLAHGNTGLFTQCVNGTTGCAGMGTIAGSISTCTGTDHLNGTGLDEAAPMECDSNALQGGGTGWLETSGNINPGEVFTLRIAIWDTSDHVMDSIAAIDGFTWSIEASQPGTVILKQ